MRAIAMPGGLDRGQANPFGVEDYIPSNCFGGGKSCIMPLNEQYGHLNSNIHVFCCRTVVQSSSPVFRGYKVPPECNSSEQADVIPDFSTRNSPLKAAMVSCDSLAIISSSDEEKTPTVFSGGKILLSWEKTGRKGRV